MLRFKIRAKFVPDEQMNIRKYGLPMGMVRQMERDVGIFEILGLL